MKTGKITHSKNNPYRHSVSEALIQLRALLGETQQRFANRLGTAVTTIARYETSRPPKGKVLAQLEQIARKEGKGECADVFRRALEKELGFGSFKSPQTLRRNPWRLYTREDLLAAYDEHVGEINRDGNTVVGIRMEFDRSDGRAIIADIAAPEIQFVTRNGKSIKRKVPHIRGPRLQIHG